jgi:hypothetical protein
MIVIVCGSIASVSCPYPHQHLVSQQRITIAVQREGRVFLTLQAYISGQPESLRRATAAFNVQHQSLSDQLHEILSRSRSQFNCHNLTATKEESIIQYILGLNSRRFAPRLCEVADIDSKVLDVRSGVS